MTKVLEDENIQVKIAENVEVKVLKGSLMDVLSKTEPAKDGDKKDGEAKEEKKGGLAGLLGGKK